MNEAKNGFHMRIRINYWFKQQSDVRSQMLKELEELIENKYGLVITWNIKEESK